MKPRQNFVWVLLIVSVLLISGHPSLLFAQSAPESAPQVKSAIDGVLDLFTQKSVVVLGDSHRLAQQEDFYSALIRDPRFAQQVGNVVVEFGGEASQAIIDRYVSGGDVSSTELRRVWTETCGWVPGPTSLGYVNFYANVRAANLEAPAEHRIKVWLGDPKIDWSTINSFQDLLPCLEHRDDNFFRIIIDEILQKHQKTLLIIGGGHLLGPTLTPISLDARINKAYPNVLATVMPFTGYIEPECNEKFLSRAKGWPVPAVAGPISGTWLKSQLQLPGCNFIPKFSSGEGADAILYLGPPGTLLQSPLDPNIYLDLDYFKQEDHRLRCCTPPPAGSLDWDRILQQNSVVPKKRP